MLNRRMEENITDWIRNSKQALLVNGARQVGKTYSIRHCLQQENCNYLEINLIEHPELIPILDQTMTVGDLIINLSTAMNYSFIKGQTVLFIDEVQELKDIVTRVKFWVDEGSFRYILSGSLLGIEMKNLKSVPVGYMHEITMYPLDFEEFIIASGVPKNTIDYLRECFHQKKQISTVVHEKIMTHFRRYLVVGGMPEAVQEYVNSGDINRVTVIQRNIIELYKKDFTQYEAQEKKLMLVAVYDQIPSQLLKQNKRFNYSDLKKGLRFERLEDSFLWLTSAGVAIPTYNATEPRVALNQNMKSSLLKLYASDVGLLTCRYGSAIRIKILSGDEKVNLGGVFENAVAQELNAHDFQTYFYNSHKIGELDFVIEYNGSVVPLEVKSGKDYYVHSAISKVAENPEYEIEEAVVLANCNVSHEGKMVYYPIYMSTFIRDDIRMPVLSLEI